jgi:hypothetical protein
MVFHDGLIDHVIYYFIVELPHDWKHNLPTLSKDLPPKLNVFNGAH